MSTSRQHVLDYISSQPAVTAPDVARALQMTGANARHHLAILETRGSIEVIGLRPAQGRGRPAKLYRVSSKKKWDNLGLLVSAFLDEFVVDVNEAHRISTIQKLVRRLIKGVLESGAFSEVKDQEASATLTQRLSTSIAVLNELNYMARWEAHADAPHVILGQCPYALIIAKHPQLCQVDNVLLEELLGVRVVQSAKQALDTRGLRYCAFSLG